MLGAAYFCFNGLKHTVRGWAVGGLIGYAIGAASSAPEDLSAKMGANFSLQFDERNILDDA